MKIKEKKLKELFKYGIIGVLTTIINVISYYFFVDILKINYIISTILSWLIAVIFAFWGNKYVVFENNQSKNLWKELNYFILTRCTTGIIDILIMFLGVELLKSNDFIIKIISNIIVIILNYILAKVFVFKQKE